MTTTSQPSDPALRVLVLNGPNLGRLGTRQPELYGSTTLAEIERWCREAAAPGDVRFLQSNAEHELIEWIHDAVDDGIDGIVINPGAFGFTSIAIVDALKMFPGPIVELHITNPLRRESYYHDSLVARVATASIAGLGARGYVVAVRAVLDLVVDD